MKLLRYISGILLLFSVITCKHPGGDTGLKEEPLVTIRKVADKIVREGQFRYQLSLNQPGSRFDQTESLDFSKVYTSGQPAVAYALTSLASDNACSLNLGISHSDGLMIWLNDSLIYNRRGNRKASISALDEDMHLDVTIRMDLKTGNNRLLLKSETGGNEWKVFLKADSVIAGGVPVAFPSIGLKGIPGIADDIQALSHWLIIGPFANPSIAGIRAGLDQVYAPQLEFAPGQMYQGISGPVTWTIPKVKIFGNLVGTVPEWGSYDGYNYYAASAAWAMMQLGKRTGDSAYSTFGHTYTNFQIHSRPFIEYQVQKLYGFNSVNHHLTGTSLSLFTLAPSMPYIYRLLNDTLIENKSAYLQWINRMIQNYPRIQARDSAGRFTRLTPVKYTTNTDDLFMALPFAVHAAVFTKDTVLRRKLFDDAVFQVFAFDEKVWDEHLSVYRHGQYSTRNVEMPHWSRTNGWAIWGITEVLMKLPATHPKYQALLAHYRKHIDGLVKLQDQSGFWFNVLDVPDSHYETSGTAIFTMAIARGINQGWLDRDTYEKYAVRGWKALCSRIEPNGTVHDICMGAVCSPDIDYYLHLPLIDNDLHGIPGLIFAALEMQQLLYTENK